MVYNLYYYGARYYDPKLSMFLGVDPLAQNFNNNSPYNYCLNNTLILVDPTGMEPERKDPCSGFDKKNIFTGLIKEIKSFFRKAIWWKTKATINTQSVSTRGNPVLKALTPGSYKISVIPNSSKGGENGPRETRYNVIIQGINYWVTKEKVTFLWSILPIFKSSESLLRLGNNRPFPVNRRPGPIWSKKKYF